MDKGWTVEVAFDWASMSPQAVGVSCPPRHDDVRRVNMSRLHRNREKTCGFDWTWSRQGIYSMHVPEMHGYVRFSEAVVGATKDSLETGA